MRIRTGLALALATLVLSPWTVCAKTKLSPDVMKAMGSKAPVRILVRAKARPLSAEIVAAMEASAGKLAKSPEAMLSLRKQQAADSRKELDAFLRANAAVTAQAEGIPNVRHLKDLWFVNAYALEASSEMVGKLAAREDVEQLILDRKVRFIRPHAAAETPERPAPAAKAWGVVKVNAPTVWKKLKVTGKGAVIGHIDTGADGSHPALKGRILHFKDFTKAAKEAAYDDEGHGTHTAGSIVGIKSKIGVAPGAQLVVAKALDGQGSGELSWLLAAMQWMLDPDGKGRPCAVSNSWGADRDALGDSAGVFRDAVKAWRDAGIVPLFSSGNSGPDSQGVPGAYPESYAIGATDSADRDADFSSGSNSEWDGQSYIRPDVAAPGVDVYSAAPGGKYVKMDGTSMACPHVAGVVALIKSAKPSLTVAEIEKILTDTAKDLGPAGKDTRFGAGLVDALKAVKAARGEGVLARR